ncbi:MAG: bifunctional response regulator/alkaline phosphatase family protein [Bacteroidetes bacterium]|nr:bifunctional response regulator/alkaline phosphatase family protein [Bacteroidota bacterium]MBU1422565.1 bifunctional response regulator/alkaline phosphatase family protein [Bacteroidota bacterium]MBU2471819.1 bifunctional response regulator/alkaline phosphatase family protein [Bacteroidota bacterium]MBU2636981.1 bifunctional response regulator/alkaline phosphatase family protein [Bacteroidota bacterium]
MQYSKGKILWVDDEIELLRPHILFLKEKGYDVETATNGEDAIELVNEKRFDIVFLDEMMAGMGGLKTLSTIKNIRPELPIIMVTKSEDEGLMENAIGGKISDYLTKPVNPSQILLACKKFLEGKKITGEHVSRDYLKEFNEISSAILSSPDENDWIDIYTKLVNWSIDLDEHPELGLKNTLYDQFRTANLDFSKFIENKYRNWLEQENRPVLSIDVVEKFLLPEIHNTKSVFFFVIDCLRLDQCMGMETILREYYNINRKFYYSILPTATPYARNAIFSGSWPNDIERRFPEIWEKWEDDDHSRNKNEGQFLISLLERRKVNIKPDPKYVKIIDPEFGKGIEQNILSYTQNKLTSIVVNFVDILAHGRSDSQILKEIAPDESAYRSLTQSWFNHSSFFNMLKTLSTQKRVKVIITTDHGSIRCMRGAKVIGDRDAATNLRYKFGRNLKVEDKHAIFIKNPSDYRLPNRGVTINYIIAKEDYYFVYPTDYHKYLAQYRDSFQHGGISMEEMILPFIVMEPKI